LEKFGFSLTYLRVWYDFSQQQRRVESWEKRVNFFNKKTGFVEKGGKIEENAKK